MKPSTFGIKGLLRRIISRSPSSTEPILPWQKLSLIAPETSSQPEFWIFLRLVGIARSRLRNASILVGPPSFALPKVSLAAPSGERHNALFVMIAETGIVRSTSDKSASFSSSRITLVSARPHSPTLPGCYSSLSLETILDTLRVSTKALHSMGPNWARRKTPVSAPNSRSSAALT